MRYLVRSLCLTAILLSCGLSAMAQDAVRPIAKGAVVVGGNTLVSDSVFQAINGKVYLDDVQVWPAVSAPAAKPVPTPSALEKRSHAVSLAVRAQVMQIQRLSKLSGSVAATYVAAFRQYPDVVDSAWINPDSGLPWVHWKGGFSEEIGIGDPTGGVPPTEDVSTTLAKVLNALRNEEGVTVYAGDGYLTLVPAIRVGEFQRQLMLSAEAGVGSESVPLTFKRRNSSLIRDLRRPVPLPTLRTR